GPSASHIARHIPMALGTLAIFSLIRFLMEFDDFDQQAAPSHCVLKSILAMGLAELAAIGGYTLLVNWPPGIRSAVGLGSWHRPGFCPRPWPWQSAARALADCWRNEGVSRSASSSWVGRAMACASSETQCAAAATI